MCGRGTSRSPKHKRSLSLHPCVVAPFLLAAQPLQQPLGPCQCSPHCRCATCNRGNADVGRDATASSTPRSLSALLQLRVVSLSHTHTHMHSVSLSTHAHIAMLTPSYDVHDVLVFGPLAGLVATPLVTRVCQLWPHVSGHKGSLPSNDSSTCCPLPPSPSTLSLSFSLPCSTVMLWVPTWPNIRVASQRLCFTVTFLSPQAGQQRDFRCRPAGPSNTLQEAVTAEAATVCAPFCMRVGHKWCWGRGGGLGGGA